MSGDTLMTRDEVADLLGIAPDSVRSTLRRYGVREERGYPRDEVHRVAQMHPRQGRRTDLIRE